MAELAPEARLLRDTQTGAHPHRQLDGPGCQPADELCTSAYGRAWQCSPAAEGDRRLSIPGIRPAVDRLPTCLNGSRSPNRPPGLRRVPGGRPRRRGRPSRPHRHGTTCPRRRAPYAMTLELWDDHDAITCDHAVSTSWHPAFRRGQLLRVHPRPRRDRARPTSPTRWGTSPAVAATPTWQRQWRPLAAARSGR